MSTQTLALLTILSTRSSRAARSLRDLWGLSPPISGRNLSESVDLSIWLIYNKIYQTVQADCDFANL